MERATILFADICGFTEMSRRVGVEQAHAVITRTAALLDAIARRHGGAIDKYLGDALMVVFGFPIAVEEAEANALAAALEMRELVWEIRDELAAEMPLDIQVGLNSGLVASGDVSGGVVREFAVMGDAVNIAARLKDRATPGEIWVGEETVLSGGRSFRFADSAVLRLKGKQRSVGARRLVGRTQGLLRGEIGSDALVLGPLFGRRQELAALETETRRLSCGEGGVVRLEGPAGVGKSRLLSALSRRLRPQSVGLFELHGRSLGNAAAELDEVLERVRGEPAVLAIEEADRVRAEDRPVVRRLLRAATRQPLLLVTVERRDGDFPEPGLLDAEIAALPELRVRALRVAPLEAGEARKFLSQLDPHGDLSPDLVDRILDRASGIPREIALAAALADAVVADRERDAAAAEQPRDTEHRRATTLFADISGFTALSEALDARVAQPLVAECLALMETVARRHGGHVEKLLGDCVLATFGVPVALEDAPAAAVNAAIEMRSAVEAFDAERAIEPPLRVHTGIETGFGIAGDLPGAVVREYALMGESVNLASRLKDLSPPGEIWVGPIAWRETRHRFDYTALASLSARDGSDPLPCWRVESMEPKLHRERAAHAVRAPLVGRERELARLRQAIDQLGSGRGAIATVLGPAGIGKTRLLEELRSHCDPGLVWLEGRSLAVQHGRAYQPFGDLFDAWAGGLRTAGTEGRAALLRRAILDSAPDEAEDLLPFLAALLDVEPTSDWRRRLDALQPDARERLTRRAAARWLERAAETRPLVLVFEDLHWADASSLELLSSLLPLAKTRPVFFLLAARPQHPETSDPVLAHARELFPERMTEVLLEPLQEDDLRRMLRALFREGEVPRRFRESLQRKAGGNPLFVEEAIRTLLDAGSLEVRDGRLVAARDVENEVVPGTIHELIMTRVDRLPLEHRRLLLDASVIGSVADVGVLESVARGPIGEAVELLIERELLTRARSDPQQLRFRHPLIQEVAYASLLESRREEIHRRVGDAIERLWTGRSGVSATLAYHYGRGGELAKAETHLFRAGDEAARAAASNEALAFFRQASDLYRRLAEGRADPARMATLERQIALALTNRGQLAASVAHYDAALAHLGVRTPRSTPAMVASGLRHLAGTLVRLYATSPGRSAPSASARDCEILDLMFRRDIVHSTTDPMRFFVDSLATLDRLLALDPYSVPESAAIVAGGISIFSFSGASFRVGRRLLDLSERLAAGGAVDDRDLYRRFLVFLHHDLEGDWSDAHGLDREDIERGLAVGRIWELTTFLDLDAERRIHRGDFATAEEWIATIRRIARDFQHELAESAATAAQAFLHIARGELAPARALMERHYEDYGDVPLNLVALGTLAKIECQEGNLDAAARLLDRADALRREGGPVAPFHASGVARSRLLLESLRLRQCVMRGERAPALLRAARRSARRARSVASRVAAERSEVLRLSGRVEWWARRPRRALAWWTRALEAASSLGARPERARVYAEAGLALQEAADPALRFDFRGGEELVERARQLFDELGLARDRERLTRGEVA